MNFSSAEIIKGWTCIATDSEHLDV